MMLLDYYLTKLAEEASEVAQIALKTQQFTMDEIRPGQELTNKQRCHAELNDLLAMVEVLNEDYGFEFVPNKEAMAKKKEKVLKYLQYSVDLGTVTII